MTRRLRDVVLEAMEAIAGRRTRSALTLLGVAFGILALVATVALTATAAAQVSARFDALKATSVSIDGFTEPDEDATGPDGLRERAVPPAGLARVAGLGGVVAVGTTVGTDGSPMVSRVGNTVPSAGVETPVMAISPQAIPALRLRVLAGRSFDSTHEDRHLRVVLLGDVTARALGVDKVDARTLIYIAGRPYLLLGIVTSPGFDSHAPLSAIVPDWVARDPASGVEFGAPQVVIQTRPGAAQQVGIEAKVALSPTRPDNLLAQVPPDPRDLRAAVETDTRALFLLMAGVSLVIGAIGIGNTTLVAVLERRHEIGLRRAIGASRRSILAQFLIESGLLGFLGGLLGTAAGLDLSISIALLKDWVAAINPWLVVVGPFLGLAVGLLAGIYPARKAARIEPVAALSS